MPVIRETSWGAIVADVLCSVCHSAQFPTMRIGSKRQGVRCEYLCAKCAARLLADLEAINDDPCEQCGSVVAIKSV